MGSHSASLSLVVTRLRRPRREANRSLLSSAQITILLVRYTPPPNYCVIFLRFFYVCGNWDSSVGLVTGLRACPVGSFSTLKRRNRLLVPLTINPTVSWASPHSLRAPERTSILVVVLRIYGAIPLLPLCLRNVHVNKFTFCVFVLATAQWKAYRTVSLYSSSGLINPLNPELNPICYLLALLGAHHFLHVSSIRVKLLTFRLLMSYIYIYGAPILDVSRSHTTTQHSR